MSESAQEEDDDDDSSSTLFQANVSKFRPRGYQTLVGLDVDKHSIVSLCNHEGLTGGE